MRSAIKVLMKAADNARTSLETAVRNGKHASYLSAINHDLAGYEAALTLLRWFDAEQSKMAQLQAQMDLAGR